MEIIQGTKLRQLFFSEGFTFSYKKLSRNEYYEKIGGSAVYYDGDVKKVLSCPIHAIHIVKLDDEGNKMMAKLGVEFDEKYRPYKASNMDLHD